MFKQQLNKILFCFYELSIYKLKHNFFRIKCVNCLKLGIHNPSPFRVARLQKLFTGDFGELVKKWSNVSKDKLSSHSEKLIIMEKVRPLHNPLVSPFYF